MRQKSSPVVADEALVASVIAWHDAMRIRTVGGYESDYVIEHGKVYWADLDAGKEYQATELIVMPVEEFLEEYVNEDITEDINSHFLESLGKGDQCDDFFHWLLSRRRER